MSMKRKTQMQSQKEMRKSRRVVMSVRMRSLLSSPRQTSNGPSNVEELEVDLLKPTLASELKEAERVRTTQRRVN